jgi:hypothetical protein
MDKFLENISKWTVKTIGVMALCGSAWNGSPIGQVVNPYFTRVPAAVEKVAAKPSNCKIIEGQKYCK